ncbi:hypothetical protein BpHYR1_042942 [Brachionus plicatilis]|uniref:Uncharacterized protein n=1 Tax=Brachionus plicatilis TaxID=10195 RepID=A0A3M7S0N0_BRAPC|nr:hypothetical protein BpHYR1_042942 [Brachionus plicatilis]
MNMNLNLKSGQRSKYGLCDQEINVKFAGKIKVITNSQLLKKEFFDFEIFFSSLKNNKMKEELIGLL